MAIGRKRTYEEVVEVFKNQGLTLLEKEFKNGKTPMKYQCASGHTGETTVASIITHGTGCRMCSNEKLKKQFTLSYSQVKDAFEREDYILVSKEYIGNNQSLSYICSNGHKGNMRYSNFQQGKRCPRCQGVGKRTTETFKEDVYELVGNEYTVLGEYINNQTHIRMRHNDCGNEWDTTIPNAFLRGTRCPKCRESKGEKAISKWLYDNQIEYKSQYRIDDCKDKKTLPFDFAIFNDGALIALIEFDGKQHYQAVDAFGGKEEFKQVQRRDKIKSDYCEKNSIPLVRIPYWNLNDIDHQLMVVFNLISPLPFSFV